MFKKLLFSASLVAGCFVAETSAQQITALVHSADSCYYNMPATNGVHVWGELSNVNSTYTTTVYWGDGTSDNSPVNNPQSTWGNFSEGHSYTSPGSYTVSVVLLDAANNGLDTSTITVHAFCHTIWGKMYKRNDANCTFDAVDDQINIPVSIQVRKNNVPYDTFMAYGVYSYTVPSPDMTSEFSFHPLNASPGYNLACPSTSSPYKVRLDTLYIGNNTFDYGYDCGSATGFDMYAYMTGFLRFVNTSYLHMNVGNAACTPTNGIVTLNISPKYVFSSAYPTPTSVSGQTVTWNLNGLHGGNTHYIGVNLTPNGTLTPGDTACNFVSIAPTTGDINLANNSYNFCDSISASYDPNEKHVAPMGDITAGQELTYTINFENLGNDTAFNVHILDTLSTNLDLSSFQLLSSSHPVRTNAMPHNGTQIVRFDFENINLGDKDHPNTNKGFVIYKAKAKASMVAGQKVENTAHIYFDINPAIVTNTVISGIPVPNSVSNITKEDGITIYPNPANDKLFIDNQNGNFNKVTLVNTLGQVMQQVNINKGVNELNINQLSSGLYYIMISGENNVRSMKITKK